MTRRPRPKVRRPWTRPLVEVVRTPYDMAGGASEASSLLFQLGYDFTPRRLMLRAAKWDSVANRMEHGDSAADMRALATSFRHLALFLVANFDERFRAVREARSEREWRQFKADQAARGAS